MGGNGSVFLVKEQPASFLEYLSLGEFGASVSLLGAESLMLAFCIDSSRQCPGEAHSHHSIAHTVLLTVIITV